MRRLAARTVPLPRRRAGVTDFTPSSLPTAAASRPARDSGRFAVKVCGETPDTMRIQLLSDLHFELEPPDAPPFAPEPAPGADLLILAGDIDSRHAGLDRFADWPVPVIYVAGNHEFDDRDFGAAMADLRLRCERAGITMLEREALTLRHGDQTVRILGTTLWNDYDLFGPAQRERCMRAARYFVEKIQRSTRDGRPMDSTALRDEGVRCRDWLRAELRAPRARPGAYDRTVVVTHFAPSLRSADPRYPVDGATASFCNAYEDMLAGCDLWLHGHLHCRHDYRIGDARVVCNARGHAAKGEDFDFQPLGVWEV